MEHVNCPGQATSLLGLASYSTTFSIECGPAHGWYPDTNTNAAVNNGGFNTRQGYLIRFPNPKGSFQCAIPMRHIFGFVDDYSKVTYGMRDTLHFFYVYTLIRLYIYVYITLIRLRHTQH